jgi:uncharacterized protein
MLTAEDLARLYPAARERSLAKTLDHIDPHAARFIGLSPFCVLASAGPEGWLDTSPRGGTPGFVKVDGPTRLLMPDATGNNRLDSFRNILTGSNEVALIFFVPGVDETLRVAGRASLTDEPALLAELTDLGRPPRSVLTIEVREAFLHCAKALMRSRLWDPTARIDRSTLPSMGQMIRDQTGLGPAETQEEMLRRYRETL